MAAVGGEIKATAAVATGRRAWLTQHIGDVENLATLQMLERSVEILANLQRIAPEVVVSDAHPGYLSRRWAADYASDRDIEAPDRPAPPRAPGVTSGRTPDAPPGTCAGRRIRRHRLRNRRARSGAVELLLGSYDEVARVGHLAPVRLPGGDAAIRFPARVAVSHLRAAGLEVEGTAPVAAIPPTDRRLLPADALRRACTPTTSVGRLFDAVASLLDVRHAVDYEAQAAVELESLASYGTATVARRGAPGR